MSKKIAILGATGSIGASALNICSQFPNDIYLTGISTHTNIEKIPDLIKTNRPQFVVVTSERAMFDRFGSAEAEIDGVPVYSGNHGLDRITSDPDNDIVVNGISGIAGLEPSLSVVNAGIDLALANKESMVCAGDMLRNAADSSGSRIIPVDSEHSALFHLLHDKHPDSIERLFLTASGGPFWKRPRDEWHTITREEALQHPTWTMGSKITIDSATMANKGLEVIEAHYLFDLDYDRISVLIHPQSLIHSMIETIDGELYAQIGPADMSIPIQNAVFYPEIKSNTYNRLRFTEPLNLELVPVKKGLFIMLDLAYQCGEKRGLYPALYNVVNELLVDAFLAGRIHFTDIEKECVKAVEAFDRDDSFNKQQVTHESIEYVKKYSSRIISTNLGI
jgi:1-deoxy-D-xylulose-5-phosphate reductoisomerase